MKIHKYLWHGQQYKCKVEKAHLINYQRGVNQQMSNTPKGKGEDHPITGHEGT
jgi:hypothetical protein